MTLIAVRVEVLQDYAESITDLLIYKYLRQYHMSSPLHKRVVQLFSTPFLHADIGYTPPHIQAMKRNKWRCALTRMLHRASTTERGGGGTERTVGALASFTPDLLELSAY